MAGFIDERKHLQGGWYRGANGMQVRVDQIQGMRPDPHGDEKVLVAVGGLDYELEVVPHKSVTAFMAMVRHETFFARGEETWAS